MVERMADTPDVRSTQTALLPLQQVYPCIAGAELAHQPAGAVRALVVDHKKPRVRVRVQLGQSLQQQDDVAGLVVGRDYEAWPRPGAALDQRIPPFPAWSNETGIVGFVRNFDPVFAACRYLGQAPGVTAVWQPDRLHLNLPGYYYLHRAIPFYDYEMGRDAERGSVSLLSFVSQIVSAQPGLSVPGYSLERDFGSVRVLRRDEPASPVRRWRDHTPTLIHPVAEQVMRRIDAHAPGPPANARHPLR